ncbi:MAG: WxL domain-containing protein [Enterococcus casseliflavus]|nr:WxL domain-containing protein [Enterococcus casseliflavus]
MIAGLRKSMLVLGMTILVMQALFLPIGIVYAETTVNYGEEQEQVELPPMTDYLNEQVELPSMTDYLDEQESNPRFFFTRSRMQGMVEEQLQVTFFSDQEVPEARVFLPEEATLIKEQLPAGISVEEGEQPQEWIVQSTRDRKTFVLPLVFEKAGTYELSVEETTAHLEISEQEEMSEEVPGEETESSDEEPAGHEDLKEEENVIEEDPDNKQSAEAPQEQPTDEEETDEASQVIEPTAFDGETAEVTTMAEFREAVANPEIGIISVQANLTEATANVLTVDRPLLIQGNGYTLTFGINGFYFQLEEVAEASALRIENATLTKVGNTPLINATVESSKNWTVELEDITEVNANTMRLASLPEGSIHFTGGVSNFTRTTLTQTFIEAKEVVATNQAEVTISRGNATVFFSSATVADPKIMVEQGAKVTITTTAGVANTLDLRGENPELILQSGELSVTTVGTTEAPTNTSNNAIALTGSTPKITMNSGARMTVTSTLAKRGIHLAGNDAQLLVNNSELSATSATQATINITGDRSSFSSENSTIKLVSTSGATTSISGESPQISFDSSTVNFTSTSGQRMNLIGSDPVLSLKNSQLDMKATIGRGVYLQGAKPQVLMENSQLLMTDTGSSQGMILQGTDALLSLSNQSELAITGAGTGTAENIQIGNNNARPELSVNDGSKVSVTTTSGTGAATVTANNAIHLRGSDPKATVTSGSALEVSITSNARRGVFLNGNNPELLVTDSQFDVTTVSGQTLNLTGTSPKITMNKSQAGIVSTTGQRMNLIGSNPVLNLKNSQLDISATTGRGIYLQGATPQVLLDGSQLLMTDTGASQGVILQGTDALLSLSNQSELEITGAGTGTTENIQIGGNNARPELSVTGGSKLSVTTSSGSGAATVSANNAINLQGEAATVSFKDNSELDIQIISGLRRGMLLTGNKSRIVFENSNFIMDSVNSTALRINGSNPELLIDKNSKFDIKESGTNANNTIELVGNEAEVRIDGQSQVKTNISSSLSVHTTNTFDIRGTAPKFSVNNSEIDLSVPIGFKRGILLSGNNAELIISKSNFSANVLRANTLAMDTVGGSITITDSSNVSFNSSTDRTGGVIDFIHNSRNNKITVEESSTFKTENTVKDRIGFRVQVLNMNGSNNTIQVSSGSNLTLDNSVATSGSTTSSNYSVVTMGGSGEFLIQSSDSNSRTTLNFLSNFGYSMNATSGTLKFIQEPNTIFTTSGSTSDSIFRANELDFVIDRPYYYDFRNDYSGGNLFRSTAASSVFAITESFFSAWERRSNFDNNPDYTMDRLSNIGYQNTNFNSISDIMDLEFGEQLSSLANISRISANNSAAEFMGYRKPTSADKSFFAQFGIYEGNNGLRAAHNNEVFARVKVTDENGASTEHQVSTNNSNITWEEQNEGIDYSSEGRIKVEWSELISTNSRIEFVEVWRGSGESRISMSEKELSEIPIIEPVNVTPPKLVDVGRAFNLYEGQTNIYIEPNEYNEPDLTAILFINGEKINQTKIESDGSINFDLDSELMVNDEVQIALQDHTGPIIDKMSTIENKFSRPNTNNDIGNMNPIESDYRYHDAIFPKAESYLVLEKTSVNPLDPLDPDKEVDPDNPPILPEDQGMISLDFVSQFNFGEQNISVKDKTYYAQPQRLLNEDGTVNETQDRPNYVQISDRRQESERNGWELAVTQKEQFKGKENQVLNGASISLSNQQVITAQGGKAPGLQSVPCELIPGNRRTLLKAQGNEGIGTWIYRFGDAETAEKSVALNVPKGSNPEATTYSTTLIWELSAVPGN